MKTSLVALIIAGSWSTVAGAADKPGDPVPPAAAEARRGVDDPRAFVAQVYEAYRAGPTEPIQWPEYAYSDRLRALFAAYDAWTAQHEDLVGSLAFDWWVNAQDWELGEVRLDETAVGDDRRVVTASFTNAGRPDEIRFHFVRQHGRWYLDDAVEGTGSGDGGWTLSALLLERAE